MPGTAGLRIISHLILRMVAHLRWEQMRRWGPEGHLVEWAFRPAAPDSMNRLEEERGFPGTGNPLPQTREPLTAPAEAEAREEAGAGKSCSPGGHILVQPPLRV